MPQVQYLNMPNIGSALGGFGSSFLDETLNKYKTRQEEDALQQVLSQFGPETSMEDKAQALLGAKNVPFQQKQATISSLSDLDKAAKQAEHNKKMLKLQEEKNLQSQKKFDLDLQKLSRKERAEYQKETDPINVGLGTLERMKQLRKKGNLGLAAHQGKLYPFGGETRKDIGAYEMAGKSLIQMVSTIPIRNRLEFEAMADKLTDPYISDAEAEGLLNELTNRLEQELALKNQKYSGYEGPQNTSENPKEKPPLDSFRR